MNENDKFWRLQHDNYLVLPYDAKNRYEAWQPGRWAANRSVVKFLEKYFKSIKKTLELGAGSAAFSLELYKQYKCDIVCVDISKEAKKYAEKIAEDMKIPITYKLGDIFEETTKADVVLSLGVIEHYTPQKKLDFIKKCASLSNKYILIAIPNQQSLIFKNYCQWAKSKNSEYEEEHKPLTVYELKNIMEKSGLEVVHIGGFQVFLSEKDFWNNTNIESIPLYVELKKKIEEKNINWPDFPVMNFSYDSIPLMVNLEENLEEQTRMEYGFMTYVLAQKRINSVYYGESYEY